jgi:hypothetical protein
MKTNFLKSLTALVGAVTLLSSSAIAGPGPRGEATTSHATQFENKSVVNIPSNAKAQVSGFQRTTTQTQKQVRFLYDAHGNLIMAL